MHRQTHPVPCASRIGTSSSPTALAGVVSGLVLVALLSLSATAQEPLGVRRNLIGMHNLKDGGVDVLTGFDWTKNLSGDTGFVFDWVFDYSPTAGIHWVGEAMARGLVPCVRVQECAGGCTPNPGYAGQVAGQIMDWKLNYHPEYADRLVYLQLWNEPGDPRDYVPMDVYADYLVNAHNAVHAAEDAAAQINPDVAGTLKTMTPGQNNPDSWEEGFSHNPQAAFAFDVWGTHPYPESYPPWYNMHEGHGGFVTSHKMIDGYLRDLDKCAEYGRRGFRVMITETAYADHLGISYEGYPKTTRQMAADYNVEAFSTWWYRWPEIVAVHPFILHNWAWEHFAWVQGGSGSTDGNGDGVLEPTAPYPQYTAVRDWRIAAVNAGLLAPARLTPYRGAVGVIRGIVTRSDNGEPVKYANVYTDGYEFGGPTLFDGQYVVREVPVGTYTLTVERRGYLPASQQITVLEDQEAVTDFGLVYVGKVPKGFYFVDCGAPGLPCDGNCPDCSLYATFHGQTFVTPSDVGFVKFAAVKPNVGDVTLRFTIIEGDDPYGPELGSFDSYYLEPGLGGEMIGGDAPGDGIPVQPGSTYFLKIQRTDGQGVYLYTSNSNPYPDGCRWVGDRQEPGWDIYGAIRGNTVEVYTPIGTIAGSVKDEANDPIVGASVTTSPGGHAAATTTGGTYTIDSVPVGTYSVSASKAGYGTGTQPGVVVSDGQTTTVNFTLEEGPSTGTISGWVKDTSNNPLIGATVQTTTGGYLTTTGDGGTYTLANVDPGTYTVQASKAGYMTEQVTGVSVIAGQITTVNINLPPEAPFDGVQNGDFEGGAFDDPDPDHRTGNGWHQFTLSGFSKSGVTWFGSGAHSPDYAQDFWENAFVSGVYQQAPHASVGNLYSGSVWVRGEGVTFWIGIDPTGGTDPGSAGIEWSSPTAGTGSWTQIAKQATAQSSTITLMLKAEKTGGASNAQFDDAELTEQYVPPPEPTISRSPATLTPTVQQGSDADSDAFTVANSGDGTLNYAVGDDVNWLWLDPLGGDSTGPADVDTITVNYATASLAEGTYDATITISDPNAANDPQTIAVTLTVTVTPPPVPPDFDHDGDVDMEDFGHFQVCLTGAGVEQDDPDCQDAKLDTDVDVDQDDFAVFQRCLSGPDVLADPSCAG